MARVKNTEMTIKSVIGHIDDMFDMHYLNIIDIENMSNGRLDLICNAFRFGYVQGMKAAKKGDRRNERNRENLQ